MTRDETTALLRLRYQATDQRFSDDTVDAWHQILEPANTATVRRALMDLIHGGASKVALGQLCERVFPQGGIRVTEREPDDSEPVVSAERGAEWTRVIADVGANFKSSTAHDLRAHKRDRMQDPDAMPTCPRCAEMARAILERMQ